ncbi:phosphoesterase family-domain-containing protein [Xylogone sp. PMI_703]|nr:phosphoesterase family-domain-containing protein [Xylogone sp. PMI_703]
MQLLNSALVLALAGIANAAPTPDSNHLQRPPHLDAEMIAALKVLGKSPSDFRMPGSLPNPHAPAGSDQLEGIDHIVMVMFENHSYDNIWGTLERPDAEGFPLDPRTGKPSATNKFENGTILHAYEMPMTCIRTPGTSAPTQNWVSSHLQYDNGSLDGFVTGNGVKPISMGYFTPEQLPFTHSIGKVFPIADRFFCSVLGQTWPNRMYLIGGTSLGVVNTGQNLTGLPVVDTIFDRLTQYGVSWKNYVAGWGQPNGLATIRLFPGDNALGQEHGRPLQEFFTDAAAGTLPSFTFLDLNGTTQSQENPQNVVVGEAVMSDIVQALGASPLWSKTLLIINYDEHGGYYDHVAPPVALAPDNITPNPPAGAFQYEGYKRYGFRVPAVVISPWAKKNHVSHVVYDHTSILAFIEKKWNLPALTYRDANANDMMDFIDLGALKARRMNFPSMKALKLSPPGNTTAALACSARTDVIVTPASAYEFPKTEPSRPWWWPFPLPWPLIR